MLRSATVPFFYHKTNGTVALRSTLQRISEHAQLGTMLGSLSLPCGRRVSRRRAVVRAVGRPCPGSGAVVRSCGRAVGV